MIDDMETVEIEGKQYEVTSYASDGLPIIKGIVTTTQDGFDEDGNPKINVNVAVPAAALGITPGEVK